MSKKKYRYKKKYKGVRYIAQRLNKYQKRKYSSYTEALPDARKFFTELQSQNKKTTLKNIWSLSKTKKSTSKKTSGVPEIDSNLTKDSFYFETMDFPTWILRCSKDLYFVSEISPDSLSTIQGGTIISYEDYFANYVNYINAMAGLADPSDNRYETEWLVTCTEPVYNKATKRYESKIISINSLGQPTDYGFDPKKPYLLPKTLKTTTTKTADPKKKPEPTKPQGSGPTGTAERAKEIRGIINDLNKQIRDIKQEVKEGFTPKQDALIQIAQIRKDISDLTRELKKGGKI
tara:strand:+ start:183 stop:1052 length:870 start_codon:yes stop_codon:yes gene_type:complete